jgi:hypothetical protein
VVSGTHLKEVQVKAALLFIELKYPLERCQAELERLMAKLPEGSKRVLHADKTVGILIPPYGLCAELKVKLWTPLQAFRNYRFIGLSGDSECKDGSMDPIEDWLDHHLGRPRRQRPKSKNVPLTERRKPWRERTV